MTPALTPAPDPAWRLIPSRFPPIGAFDTVASPEDLQAVMELEGWTNDRLVAERLARLPPQDWMYGVPNSSVVMAAFLHAAPGGGRFSGPELGAWYAAAAETTAIAEVAHHLRREAVARGLTEARRTSRCYTSQLLGTDYIDLRGQQATRPGLYANADYGASQVFGEAARAAGSPGIVFDSLRHTGGVNVAAFRPRNITRIVQRAHYDILVPLTGKVVVMTCKEAVLF